MTNILIPAVVSRSGLVSWPRVSEEPVRSLHIQSVIGIETSAAIVVLFKIGVDHGHTRACVANFVLGYGNLDRDTPATTAGAQGTNSKIVGIQRTHIDHEKDDARQFALARYRLRTGYGAAAESDRAVPADYDIRIAAGSCRGGRREHARDPPTAADQRRTIPPSTHRLGRATDKDIEHG